MLLRPIRMLLLITLAFVAGVFYERARMGERCESRGGEPRGGICVDIAQ